MKQLARSLPLEFTIPTTTKSQKRHQHDTFASKRGFRLKIAADSNYFCNTGFYDPTQFRHLCKAMYLNRYRDANAEIISISSSSSSSSSSSDSDNDSEDESTAPLRESADDDDEQGEEAGSAVGSLLDGLEALTIHRQPSKASSSLSNRTPESYHESIDARKSAIQLAETSLGLPKYDFDALYKSTEFIKKPVLEPLTDEEEDLVRKLMRGGQSGEIAQHKTAIVEYKDIYKLAPETWLNDEIINFYMDLIVDRAESDPRLPSVHCFNTFFCSTLRESGYAKVRRWTKRVDIFSKDLVFIPINYSYHWTLGMIDMKRHTIQVYDSLGGSHDYTLKLLKDYLAAEHQDKKKQALDLSDWKASSPKGIPQQRNMSDCGVFTCTFAERLSRRQAFEFSQDDMILIRKRMVLSIVQKKII